MTAGRVASRTSGRTSPGGWRLRDCRPMSTEVAGDAVPLVCAECAAVSPSDADGWRAYLADDGDAVMFCPDCASREFES
jgi:hypothetical protein